MADRDSYPHLIMRREEEEDGEWIAGFCGCLADPSSCLLTTILPCAAFGQVVEKLDQRRTSCATGALVWFFLQYASTCGCLYSCSYRRKLRKIYNLPNRPLPDWAVHYFCWPCAFCQELRELKARETIYYGYDSDERRMIAPPPQTMGSRY